eukprot:1194892-Prorocentrum_minimum.AAC.1
MKGVTDSAEPFVCLPEASSEPGGLHQRLDDVSGQAEASGGVRKHQRAGGGGHKEALQEGVRVEHHSAGAAQRAPAGRADAKGYRADAKGYIVDARGVEGEAVCTLRRGETGTASRGATLIRANLERSARICAGQAGAAASATAARAANVRGPWGSRRGSAPSPGGAFLQRCSSYIASSSTSFGPKSTTNNRSCGCGSISSRSHGCGVASGQSCGCGSASSAHSFFPFILTSSARRQSGWRGLAGEDWSERRRAVRQPALGEHLKRGHVRLVPVGHEVALAEVLVPHQHAHFELDFDCRGRVVRGINARQLVYGGTLQPLSARDLSRAEFRELVAFDDDTVGLQTNTKQPSGVPDTAVSLGSPWSAPV